MSLTNYDLINKAKDLHINLIGVFSKDELPYKRYDGGYIINLQDNLDAYGNFNEGSHWTCFYIQGKQACYFDSFGFIMPRQVQEFLKPYKPIIYNLKQIQNIRSSVCGYYCLLFLKWFQAQKDIKSFSKRLDIFCNLFSDDTEKNKSILEKYIKIK